ncbi:hypothetical protein ACHAW6_008630 [Cyclotella cf. meneghiniana]
MKLSKANNLVRAYQTIHQCWKDSQVISVNWHILDNEAPRKFKPTICSNCCTIELTPPDIHRHNNAEHIFQTFESHFTAILAGVDNSFPINKWDSLLLQADLTLNLLQNANAVPKTTTYAYRHGPFDYDRMPLAPLGCVVQFHVKPSHCRTWGEHSLTSGTFAHHQNTFAHISSLSRPHALIYKTPFTLNTNTLLNPWLLQLTQL